MKYDFLKITGKKVSDFVYKKLESGSGNMILLTSMIGIGLSTIAQTGAILLNDKYTMPQKAFLIPQELTDGCITIASMFVITRPLQGAANIFVKTGKITTSEIKNYMNKHHLIPQKGHLNFDFRKSVDNIISSIKKSDEYIRSNSIQRDSMLTEHKNIIQNYNQLADASSAIASTIGSVISTAAVSPFIRNYSASYYQKASLNISENMPEEHKENKIVNPVFTSKPAYYHNPCRL